MSVLCTARRRKRRAVEFSSRQKLTKVKIDPRDDLLLGAREAEKAGKLPSSTRTKKQTKKTDKTKSKSDSAAEDHINLFVENRFPSAATCGVCHPKHFVRMVGISACLRSVEVRFISL